MAAVLTLPSTPGLVPRAGRSGRSVGARRPHPTRVARSHRTAAVYRRRRFVAAALGLGIVVAAGQASAALGGSSLAPAERRPQVTSVVVEPGDTLWSIADEVAPERRSAAGRRRAGRGAGHRASCCRARRSPGSASDRCRPHTAGGARRSRGQRAVRWIRALSVLPGERRQGRRLARRRRRRRHPAAAGVPRVRPPLHDLRARRRGRARRAEALG